MDLNLRELAVFRTVMAEGGVTAAATALGISQPAASKMLRQAENRLGFPLFRRDARRLVPTAEAHALLPELLGAFAAIDGLERLAGALRAGRGGQLSIAAVPVLATALLPPAIQRFRVTQPDVLLRLRAMSALEVVNQVADHQADLGIILGTTGDLRVAPTLLCRSEVGVALPPGHALATRRRIGLTELAGEALVTLGPQQPVGRAVRDAWQKAGMQDCVAIEVSQSSIACALVRAAAGIAVLDGFGLAEAAAQGLAIRRLSPRLPLAVTLVVARGRALPRLAEGFRSLVEAEARRKRRAG